MLTQALDVSPPWPRATRCKGRNEPVYNARVERGDADSGRRAAYLPLSAGENDEPEDGVQVRVRRAVPAEDPRQLESVGDHAERDLHHVQDEQRQPHLLVRVLVLPEPVRRRRLAPVGPADEDHGPGDDQLDDRVRVEPPTGEWASKYYPERAPGRQLTCRAKSSSTALPASQ